MKESSYIMNVFPHTMLNFISENKKKSLRIALFIFYLLGVLFIIRFTIQRYLYAESMTNFKLLFFRSVAYFTLYSIFCLFVWLSTIKYKTEKKFAILASLFGICYMFIMTPFSIPDESGYYYISYSLSNKIMFNMSGYGLASQLDASPYLFVGHQNVPDGYISIVNNLSKGNLFSQSNELREVDTNNILPFKDYFVQNLPQALGITAARLLGGNFLLLFYSARFFNLLFYVICGYFAIKKLSRLKTSFSYTMFLIGLMPMVLHQAGSVSYDTFGNGLAFLLTASILSVVFGGQQLSKIDFLCIFICSVLLAPFKLVYFPLCFLCLLIPREQFKTKTHNVLCKVSIITCSLTFLVVFQINTIMNVSDLMNWDVYTPDYIIHHPFKTVIIIARTVYIQFADYFLGAIGTNMSGLSLSIPTFISLTLLVVLLFSTISGNDDLLVLSVKQKIVSLIIIFAVALLILVGEMLHWTLFGSDIIHGVQPRYFIPIFPLFFIMLKNKIFVRTKETSTIFIGIAVLLQCMVLAHIVQITINKFF